ncbi:MAG: hypothetical protein GF344_16280 [Chitinivibrionales bacterium]|nr:hypothetical protein [Chitinivibrionales bacterium]
MEVVDAGLNKNAHLSDGFPVNTNDRRCRYHYKLQDVEFTFMVSLIELLETFGKPKVIGEFGADEYSGHASATGNDELRGLSP